MSIIEDILDFGYLFLGVIFCCIVIFSNILYTHTVIERVLFFGEGWYGVMFIIISQVFTSFIGLYFILRYTLRR